MAAHTDGYKKFLHIVNTFHVTRKRRIIIIRRRNGAKTISLQTLFGRLNNNNKKQSKNNKSPNVVWET
jgi:hypothetical protein